MPSKPTSKRPRGSHTAAQKPAQPQKRKRLEFGKLSRSQKQTLLDYGELDPIENVAQIGNATYSQDKVFDEADLDQDLEDQFDRQNYSEDETNYEEDARFNDTKQQRNYDKLLAILGTGRGAKTLGSSLTKNAIKRNAVHANAENDEENEDEPEHTTGMHASTQDTQAQEQEQEQEDNPEQEQDPFSTHFSGSPDHSAQLELKSVLLKNKKWATSASDLDSEEAQVIIQVLNDDDIAQVTELTQYSKQIDSNQLLTNNHVKARLVSSFTAMNPELTHLQTNLVQHLTHYRDLWISNATVFGEDSEEGNLDEIRQVVTLHLSNHILKIRDRIIKNNSRLAAAASNPSNTSAQEDTDRYKDQGYTRPSILILTPLRSQVYKLVNMLLQILNPQQIENKSRFKSSFYSPPEEQDEKIRKPKDWEYLFGGNNDDSFVLGIKVTRKNVKLFSSYKDSDIIVASPLGWKVGVEKDPSLNDHLSSLSLLYIDLADVFLMQNMSHLHSLLSSINKIPQQDHGTDFSRVKEYLLDGRGATVRQTIMVSLIQNPDLTALWNGLQNVAGRFVRTPSCSLQDSPDKRFEYFITNIIPQIRIGSTFNTGTMIFIPSYFDYIRVKSWLKEHDYTFGGMCEYTSNSFLSRHRTNFFHQKLNLIVYTERLHFYRRFKVRGIQTLIFYAPPTYPEFYNELSELAKEVKVVYSAWDRTILDPIVGRDRSKRLCEGDKGVYLFA